MPPEQKSNGALIGTIIVILILVVGGIYFYRTNVKNRVEQAQNVTQPTTQTDELAGIANDANSVDVNGLDSSL